MIDWDEVNRFIRRRGEVLHIASGYHGRRGLWDPGCFAMRETIADTMSQARLPKRALDLGCGCGQWLLYLSSRNVAAVGVDRDPLLVKTANELLHRWGYPALASLGDLQEQRGTYELVTAFGALYDVYQPAQFPEMLHYLRGLLVQDGWLAFEYYVNQEHRLPKRGYASTRTTTAALEAGGFRVMAVSTRQTREHENALYTCRRS